MKAADFAALLQHVTRNGDRYMAACPAHADANPSLSVRDRAPWTNLKCFAGCTTDEVLGALNLQRRDLHHDTPSRRAVAQYAYRDENGHLLYQEIRYEPKDFRPRRVDDRGGVVWDLDGARRVLYRLPELLNQRWVAVVEGEKDADGLASFDIAATTNAMGAGSWSDEYTAQLVAAGVKLAVVVPDNDTTGEDHAAAVARSCLAAGLKAKIVRLPDLPEKGDVSDWLNAGHTAEEFIAVARSTAPAQLEQLPRAIGASINRPRNPWASGGQNAYDFAMSGDLDTDWLITNVVAKGLWTQIFSPRGIGKTVTAIAWAIDMAKRGVRVLYLDRDNPPQTTKRRFRRWGIIPGLPLTVRMRDEVPPLTDGDAWRKFPTADYAVIILDSQDSATEGVGEQDSARPSRAIASVLNVVRTEGGPGLLSLGNDVKSARHSRGSGVVEDRGDIVYEIRDATEFVPTGARHWTQELPPASAADWLSRSRRRKRRERYRLAFFITKFRDEQEPGRFVLEVRLPDDDTWSLHDVTGDFDQDEARARRQAEAQSAPRRDEQTWALEREISRRANVGEEPLTRSDAADFLMELSGPLKAGRNEARRLIEERMSRNWVIEKLDDRPGQPQVLRLWVLPSREEVRERTVREPVPRREPILR